MVSTRTLVQIAAWGGLIVSSTGFYLQGQYIDKIRNYEYYRNALKSLRHHPGAVYYMGEPIKDKRFKITDTDKNYFDAEKARFCIPVSGPKDRGSYYIWAKKNAEEWNLTKAELELKSKPEARLARMFVGTAREKYFYHNTLLCLVRSCQEKNVTVDLRNDSYICGKIETVDGFMNVTFADAVYCDPQGNEFAFENLFIQGRNIRYVHIPENVDILNAVQNELVRTKRVPDKKPIQKSRKVQKAMKQHMQTVASLSTN